MATWIASLLRDDFDDNSISPAWAKTTSGSATGTEALTLANFALPSATAGTHDARYTSTATYDLTGDSFNISINTMVATGVAATAYFILYLDASNYYQWVQTSGTLKAQKVVAGVLAADLYSVAWSATTYKYLRIRESGGTVFFDSSTSASAGAVWTNRGSTTIASAFAVTSLSVILGASCGNVASPGTFKLDSFNTILPALATNWRDVTADWQITNRMRPVTVASTGNAVGVLITATTMDTSRVLGGTVRYFAGPVGSASGGYAALTEYSTLAAAQAMAFQLPTDGRVDLPAMVDCRYMRLYFRSSDGATATLREYVPRRIVQADDIEAESIKAINIAASTITADKIAVLDLDASHYITAGGKVVTLNNLGISIIPSTTLDGTRSYVWRNASNTLLGGIFMYYDTASSERGVRLAAYDATGSGTASTEDSIVNVNAYAVAGKSATIQMTSTVNATSGILALTSTDLTLTNVGFNVGTTGAGAGEIKTSGAINTTINDATTAAVTIVKTLGHNSTGTPAAGFGSQIRFNLETTTTPDTAAAAINVAWTTATHASRQAQVDHYAYDSASARVFLSGAANGTAAKIGFLGSAPVVQQASGADLTNSVTSGGTNDTITNWTNLATYSTDAAAIRNATFS
jgi:hypothetical protein